MDIFTEQLVKIKLGPIRMAAIIMTYLFAAAASAVVIFVTIPFNAVALGFLVSCGIFYIAWRSASQYRVEYEYIITNGEFDIDKIVNERKRTRAVSFKCSEIESIKKYNKNEPAPSNTALKLFACTADENSYAAIIRSEKKGLIYLVFSPDERTIESMKKYIPKSLSLQVFGN